ncbi:uncharacterized protein LOC110717301 [Chenopodium quinoa]|uniref:uncharacterized protein LOC110717301 n=1 Tax=Chenopodium quinoa TaxID=63459 RepID=UPI000B79677E|nr:uncharacterized protein LOC110717301 [Chenopodium quinoa]
MVVNWKKSFPRPLLFSLFWRACNANSAFTFKKAMDQLGKVNPAGRIWLSKLGDQKRWSKHKFNTELKCDVNVTNFVESFNATLGLDRSRPVMTLLESVRRNTMVRMAKRRQVSETWKRQDICPHIIKRIQQLIHESRTCIAYMSAEGEYEVQDSKSVLPVNLNNHTCLCNVWHLTEIPCRHGIRAIIKARLDPHSFVNDWYSVTKYKEAYSCGIKSIPDVEQWPPIDMPHINPPPMKRGIGRPTKERKRADDEERKGKRAKTVRCSNCKAFGHNAATCKGGMTAKQKASYGKKGKKKQQAPPSSQPALRTRSRSRSAAAVATSQP